MTAPGTMTLVELQTLIADSKGEWEHIEFKKTTGELQGGMVTLCGFLNGSGGKVLFGVTNAGKIQGQDTTDATLQDVANAIRKLEPPVWIDQIRIPVSGTKEVLMLETTLRTDGPYTFDGRPYLRIGNTTSRMPQAEYQRRLLARANAQGRWEREVAERYTVADLDLAEVERTLRAAVHQGRLESQPSDPVEGLDRLHLRVDGHLLRAVVVLFGRKLMPDFPQCALRLARFKGTTKTEFLDQRQLHGHAFVLLDEAVHFIMRHIPVAGRIEPGALERQDTPLYPPLALREALVNALCHRDYTIPGGAVNVAIFDDRLEIISAGLLPAGITVDDLKRNHVSFPRNPLIAGVFFRRGLIEQWGRGTQKMVDWCVAAGQPEPEFEEQAGAVVVRFLPSAYTPPLRVSHDLTDRQRQVLLILSDGKEWRLQEIYAQLQNPPTDRTVRQDLTLLRQAGLVGGSGRGAGARWWLVTPGTAGRQE
jgi:ATP-dependent DNA helicase RecG